jgi:hypothetical protein
MFIFEAESRVSSSVDPYSGVLIVQVADGQGSCFVVARQGDWWYAITAGHVVEFDLSMPGQIMSVTVDEELYEAEIVRISGNEDVALIRFKSPETYKIYSFAKAKVGAPCTTVGWNGKSKLVYKGNIVTLDYNNHVVANGGVIPGCSGGVLLNQNNEAIGVTVAVSVFRGWAFDNTALYVPARFARALIVTIE